MRSFCLLLSALFLVSPGVSGEAARRGAGAIAASLDDSSLAAQVLLAGIDGRAALAPASRALLERIPPGGIMLFRYNLDTPKDEVKTFLKAARDAVAGQSGIPPFMAVDHEGGLVHRFGPGVARLPPALSFWEMALKEGRDAALSRARALYRSSAEEIHSLGITMVLGPVAEPLTDNNRTFLDTRSYGSDSGFVEAAAGTFIESMKEADIACVVKHFPGNSGADPHSGVSTLRGGRAALDEMARPFAGLIRGERARPRAVMISHAIVNAIDPGRPASLSPPVIEDWLRGELGFDGIVLADDFSMAGVSLLGLSPAAAAVEALNAGVDMVMAWPANMDEIHAAILNALEEGRLPRSRLLEAARRVIACKIRLRLVPLPAEPLPAETEAAQ